jgi:hypothetical protein
MKKLIEIEAAFCDNCGRQEYTEACLGSCGLEVCWRCKQIRGVEYKRGVYVSGSGDGFYCTPCDQRLSEDHTDRRHTAYQVVRALRDEYVAWHKNFTVRQ